MKRLIILVTCLSLISGGGAFAQEMTEKIGHTLFYNELTNAYDTIHNTYIEKLDAKGTIRYLKQIRFNKDKTVKFTLIEERDSNKNLIFSGRDDDLAIHYRYDAYGNMVGYSYDLAGKKGEVDRELVLDVLNRPVQANYLFNKKPIPKQKEYITWKSGVKSVSRLYVNGKLSQIEVTRRKFDQLQYKKTIEFSKVGRTVKQVSVRKYSFKKGVLSGMRHFENKQLVFAFRRFFDEQMNETYRAERYGKEDFEVLIIF